MAKGKPTSTSAVVMLIIGMLLSGCLNTITTKIQFTMYSTGIDGERELFKKTWSGAFNMMFAMALVMAVERCFHVCCKPSLPTSDYSSKLLDPGDVGTPYWRKVCLVSIPAAFDLIATALCCVGMLYIPASVWQMLRGASLVFAAILSILFLKRQMLAYHWLGLVLCVLGITIVGSASILGEGGSHKSVEGETWTTLFGMGCVLAGQVVQAAQVIAEEFFMKSLDLPAMHVVGYEGIWGVIQMCLIVYPILYVLPGDDHGHQEDVFDTLAMISNNQNLALIILAYLFSCSTFNATGIAITGALSAVHRTMLDASRTMLIWAFDLFIHYCIDPNSAFGEVWTEYSYLQLFGFAVLVLGQGIYGEVIKVPCLKYPPPMPVDRSKWASPGNALLASPLPPTRERADSASL